VLLAIAASACEAELPQVERRPACRQFQFRACNAEAGRGSQHCEPSGEWSECTFVTVDADFSDRPVDAPPDAESDADSDAPPDAFDGDAPEADASPDAPDAATDAAEEG
jgi:hypothetical protein